MGRRKTASAVRKDTAKKNNAKNSQQHTNIISPAAPQPAIGQVPDANGRRIFKNNSLCAQFIKDNIDIPELKNIMPEDITDVTEKYQAYLGFQLESDTVKRIRLHTQSAADSELFVVSLIEHKSKVDYNVAMQLFRYMNCIWTEYAREMEGKQKGISRTKSFRYPPILPIVYYEGAGSWTAGLRLSDRIHLSDVFKAYIPDFTYKLVRIHDYTNEELLDRKNEMSFLMMINRIQSAEDLAAFLRIEQNKVNDIVEKASPQVLEIIADTLWSLCMKMNIPVNEAEECVRKIKEQNMGLLFENMEKMDIQEERRKTAAARKELEETRQQVTEARQQMTEVRQQVTEARQQAADARQQTAETQKRLAAAEMQFAQERREAIRNIVSLYQRVGETREAAIQAIMSTYHMEEAEAQKEAALYWKA